MSGFIRLNSVPTSLFSVTGERNSREDLVAVGRLLMCEYCGNTANTIRKNSEYKSVLDPIAYRTTNENYSKKLFMHCAKIASNALGEDAPETYSDFLGKQREYMKDPTFLKVLAGIARDVVTPMLPYVSSNVLGDLAQTVTTRYGKTFEVTIKSNEAFVFQDSSWGASRSVEKNYLYDDVVTLNPKPVSAACKVKWYQLIGNAEGGADMGRFYNALAAGLANKILALWNGAMTAIASNAQYVPEYLRFASYTTANWVNAARAVSMANGVPRERLMAYGDFSALSRILPSGTAQDAALTTLLGQEYMSRGYLGTVSGIPTAEMTNAYVAGQVNLPHPTELLPTTTVYMIARAGEGYAPVYICFEENPITLELTPSQTGDETIDVNLTASVDAKGIAASKFAVISNV